MDVYKRGLAVTADRINRGVFSELMIVDPDNNLVSDLYHPENDGNFSQLPFLSKIISGKEDLFIGDDRMVSCSPLSVKPFTVAGSVPLGVVLSNLSYLVKVALWMMPVLLFSCRGPGGFYFQVTVQSNPYAGRIHGESRGGGSVGPDFDFEKR